MADRRAGPGGPVAAAPLARPARLVVVVLALATVVLGLLRPGSAGAAPAGSTPLFTFSDDRIDEASGIARGIRSPGVFYVQNDSGDSARFFALDASTGKTLAVYTVPGATNVDWEDLAVATDARGVPSIWIADTGDNNGDRAEVRVYRVDEPTVDRSRSDVAATTSGPQIWRFTYPDGPQDVEALAVAPGGAMYVFDKVFLGATNVYALPLRSNSGQVRPVTKIGSFDTVDTGTAGGPNPIGRRSVTGASLSARGNVLAVRTYTDAYLWRIGADGVAGALKRTATRVALPAQPQGEGITVEANRLVTDSEKVGSTVWSVPLPALAPLSDASSAAPAPTVATRTPSTKFTPPAWAVAGVGVLAILGAFVGAMVARARRGRRP